jgi:hypothetical protein
MLHNGSKVKLGKQECDTGELGGTRPREVMASYPLRAEQLRARRRRTSGSERGAGWLVLACYQPFKSAVDLSDQAVLIDGAEPVLGGDWVT